ncbi:trans-aconitate 2-methyltransferase [Thalassobium sp. R2A62]|jgi:SAM-dependent methyltransferase|uniref:class I SAM-dependent methyltransferase n=1 Tax=Thalassobium sp. R2A62 TaxID=633131 RepID=UPI0001B1D340|nr:class I SAM-dependent methyltransferase [Thalassobium sp. R2A62]EET49815.1 Methyltransferase domain family protein [Thalassobium sp. R2A62]MDG1340702.1 class I SAM-dependent methyltransferase [Paracoccaceae bacterium]MDG2451721.1 class I SAM-dependent methyltransferase [Paracoccaceae bacterium]
MEKRKMNTQAIGLDAGLKLMKWLTGLENLHYGYWEGLEVTAGNLREAQEAYTVKLFKLLPSKPCRILDIGGGAGETAKKLVALGHTVDIVVPSPLLADRCRANAPEATVHEMVFEDFESDEKFDICLFSESFQYIPLDESLPKCLGMLAPGGEIIVSDCFRTPEYSVEKMRAKVGGGHRIGAYREALASMPIEVVSEEDITVACAPSVEIEQGMFNVVGYALGRIDDEMAIAKPKSRWALHKLIGLGMNERKRSRLNQRLNEQTRNRDEFIKYNQYLMMKLRPTG